VEWLDFERFKDRYAETDDLAIIEVLIGHPQIAQEVARETERRAHGKKDIRKPKRIPKPPVVDGDSYWAQRIRIQSPQLILLLSRLSGHQDKWPTDKPHTFFAPFRGYHYYLPWLRQSLEILEARWSTAETPAHSASLPSKQAKLEGDLRAKQKSERRSGWVGGDADSSIGPDNHGSDDSDGNDDGDYVPSAHVDFGPMPPYIVVSGDLIDSDTTLLHLRKFVNIIERDVEPFWHRAAGTT